MLETTATSNEDSKYSLSSYVNYIVDWSRIGSILRSGRGYTFEQLVTRGAIIVGTAAGTYAGSREDSYPSRVTGSQAWGGFISLIASFIVLHAIVILPLIAQRLKSSKECREQELQILRQLARLTASTDIPHDKSDSLQNAVTDAAKRIMEMNCEQGDSANATLTWDTRKRQMQSLAADVDQDVNSILSLSGDELNNVDIDARANKYSGYPKALTAEQNDASPRRRTREFMFAK